jgi:acetyl esterase/lipase
MDMTAAVGAAGPAVLSPDAAQAAFPVPGGIRVVRDLVYAAYETRQLRLDLYLPAVVEPAVPGVLVLRGGAWRMGDKETLGYLAAQLAAAGFAAASAEYRPSAEATYPAAVHDAKAAVRWLRAHGARYGIDADAIGAIGASSGGYLAAMLATTSREPAFEGSGGAASASSRVQAVVTMGGVGNLALWDASVAAFLGPAFEQRADLIATASPVSYVSPQSAPMLLLHSRLDPLVPFEQSIEMERLYRAAGVPVTLVAIEAPHLHTFWYDPRHCVELLAQAVPFFRTHLARTA